MLNASGQWEFMLNFAVNWVTIANNTMTPVVLFTFNRDVRLRFKEMLDGIRKRRVADSSVITVLPSV